MREQVSQGKKATTSVSIPTLKQPTRGFGLESSNIAPQATPEVETVETVNEPLTHDISKISLRPQAKLSISQPGDFYEQQADSIAQQVMRRMAQPVNRHSIQRQEISEEKEDTEKEDTNLQMKPLVNFVTPLVQRQQMPEAEELQMKSVYNSPLSWLQRQQMPEEEEEPVQMKSMVQRIPGTGGIAATSDLETSIKQSRGGGQPLADDIKQPMEQAFGADFGSVRVHTDGNSDNLNKSIQARAFTTGQDIFFRQGEYSPGSSTGKELLAHELTHVIQQNGNSVQRKSLNSAAKSNKLHRKYTDDGQTIPLGESPQPTTQPTQGDQQNQTDEIEAKNNTDNPENSEQQNQATTENQQTASTPPAEGGNGTTEPPPTNKNDAAVESAKNPAANQEKQPNSNDNNPNPQKISPQQQGQPEGKLPGVSTGLPGESAGQANAKLLRLNVNNITATALGTATGNGEKAPAFPEADPEFQAVVNSTKQVAVEQKEHPPANTEAQEAQDAAEPPGNEVESKAQANQVGEMGQAQTSGFDAAALKAKLMERIADMAPKNLKEADEFKNGNKLDSVKSDLSGQVKEEKKESQGDLEEKTKAKPDTSGIETKQVTPLTANNPGTAPANIGADKAAPKYKGQGEIEAPLQQEIQNLDQQMANANITEEQLAKSNQPEFQTALTAKKEAQTDAVQGPAKYRQEEQGIIANAKATAEATAQQHLQGMHGIRNQNLGQVAEQQVGTKGKDEQAREKVAGDINKIYEGTKTKVEKILNDLDGKVIQEFDAGAAKAKKSFEDYVGKRMDDYKKERYSGFWGPGKWLLDQFLGLPSEVNVFYTEGRELYIKEMDGAINKVVTIISKELTQAKAEITKGKQEIQNYINKLPQDLKGVGQEAAATIESKFEELEQNVDNKQNELIDTLAQKYQENLQAVDARIEEMKAANKGLIQKALDFIVGVVKTIIELTKMLIEVLARVASVVGEIIKNPIGFLSNLVSAVKQGFLNFMKNIGTHLQNGLISWLTGTMAEAGIELPEKFDLKGIFSFVMQLLGFTYEGIRAQAVKRLGEEKVGRMEQTVEVFKILATEGVGGIWQFVQEKIGDLNSLVIEPIKNFVIEKVITAGIEWVLSLLTPASAFIQAAKKIYEIVKFFIDNAQRIADLIHAILDSIVAIASGSIDQAVKGVENALAKSLPVVISFLASLLGLGGISQKIQAIILKLRKPMETAVDWVIDKGKKAFKKVSNKFNNSKVGKKFNAAKDAAVEKYKAGKQWVEDKKAAGEKWFDDQKQALLDATEKRKAQFANTKFGKALNSANDGLGKKLDALDKKRQSFNNKIEAAKEWPSKQLEKVQDKAAELRGKAGDKIKNSKFGKSFGKTWDQTKELGSNKKEALSNKLGFGKGKNKTDQEDAKDNSPDKKKASPDERKTAAKEKFIALMKAKKTMSREDMNSVFVKLKTEFELSDIKLEGNLTDPKIGFYASPATFLPLNSIPISGQKPGANAANRASVKSGDYIKAIRYDGPFPTPGKEVVDAFNKRFEGEATTYNNGQTFAGSPPKKKAKGVAPISLYEVQALPTNSLTLKTATNSNSYYRAGTVEAQSSVTRGVGRSGSGETVFGHFGADEERIKTGNSTTNYNGGHLVGDQIMDSHNAFNLYEDWNLAPQQRSFNSPVYTGTIENAVTKAINAGATIKYTVTVQYPSNIYQIQPSVLIKNLLPSGDPYRQEIEGAIKNKSNLDSSFTLHRRTPGFWQAKAEVIKGSETISSGDINQRDNIAFENKPANVQPGVNYQPTNPEQVRYSLEVNTGAGLKPLKAPTNGDPIQYSGATQVEETARQETF
jgi:hypothetical protein